MMLNETSRTLPNILSFLLFYNRKKELPGFKGRLAMVQTVSGMDAAPEPPGMDSRRV